MPSNKQAQPLKPLLKTWTGWERGIGYLPESDEEETKGLYYANGILGIHGELRPAPFFRHSTLKSHILRRIYDTNNDRQAAAIALQIPNAVQGTQPTIESIGSKNGATSSAAAAEFAVGTFQKSTDNNAQVVNHAANFTVKGAMFWSADGEVNGTDATSKTGAGGMIGFADGTTANDRSISWNAEDASGDVSTEVVETLLNSDFDPGTIDTISINNSFVKEYVNPTPFNSWSPSIVLKAGKMNIITIVSSSNINTNPIATFTMPGATFTLIKERERFNSARITVYRSVPSSDLEGFCNVTWAVNQTDVMMQVTTFNGVVVTGTNGSDGIPQSKSSAQSLNGPRINLAPLQKTGNAMFGSIMTTQEGDITPSLGLIEIDQHFLNLGDMDTQREWRIDSDNPADPIVRWQVGGNRTSYLIAMELSAISAGKNSFITSQYTPHSDRLVLLAIDTIVESGVPLPPTTVTGTTGLSWTRVESQSYDNSSIATRNLSVWRALKTSGVSNGTETLDYNGITQTSIKYIFTEYANVNLTVDGAGAVQQFSDDVNDSTTTPSTTLGTFDSVDNATYGVHAVDNDSAITAGSGFTSVANPRGNGSLMTEFKEDNDTSVDATCTSGNTASIAIEIEFVATGSGAANTSRSYDNSCIHFVNEDALGTFPSALCTFTDDNNLSLAWSNNASGTPSPTPDAINFILFGGNDIDTEVVEWTNSTSQGDQEITQVSIVPTCLITIGTQQISQTTSGSVFAMFGITDGTNQFAQAFTVEDGVEPSTSSRRTTTTYSLINQNATSTTVIKDFMPSGGTGWTWTHTQFWPVGFKWATLAIKGVKAEVGQFTRDTNTGGQPKTSISILSDSFILTGLSITNNDKTEGSASWTMGAASELSEAACSTWTDETAQGVTDNYAYDIQQNSGTTTSPNTKDIMWVELGVDDGAVDVLGGVNNMDIGVDDWMEISTGTSDLTNASLINYVGFTSASDPKFTTDSFNTTGNSDANTELIVAIATKHGGNGTVNNVIFNTTESLTQIAVAPDTTDYALEIWHITNPTEATATIVITTESVVDIIVGIWLVEGASDTFSSGTFKSNDIDANDYFSAGIAFNQPDVSLGQSELNNIDLILGVSVDDSAVQDSGTKDGAVTYTSTGMTDTRETLAINKYKGYTLTGTNLKSSISINTNDAVTLFIGHQPGWGNGTPVSGGGGSGDPWEISGTSVGSLENISFDEYKSNMHMVGTYLDTLYHKWQSHWYMEESIGTDDQYMYISRGRPSDTSNTAPDVTDPPVLIQKIDLRNATFGDDLGVIEFTDLTFPGQLARYKGNWFFPSSGTINPRKLTVGTGLIDNDTWPALTQATGNVNTVEHIANGAGTGGFQLVGMRATEGWRETISEIVAGITVNPDTEEGWASYFGAGDKDERAAGLASVGGGDVFLNKDGLWSYYSNTGRSSLIFEDFKIWRSLFDNIPISPWRGGILVPHPSGLLFWSVGQLPVNIGFDAKTKSYADPPTSVTNFNQGRYLGVVGVGDFIYTLYQPDITSSEINVLCGYLHTGGRKEEIVWQVIGTTFLYNSDYNSNVGVSLLGKPISSSYETPTLWFNNGNNMSYVYLDDRAGPFRSIQRLTNTGFALLPELFFPERMDMSEMIIYTQGMRPNSDSWQLSMFADNGKEIKLGSEIYRNGRTVIKINRHNIYRVMFKITWDGQSASEAPKVIGTDIAIVDSGGSGVDTITSASSAFGDFIVGDEIEIIGSAVDDGNYTLLNPVSAGTISVVTGSFTGESAGLQITIQSRHRETPAIKRIELYGQPTTRGASG